MLSRTNLSGCGISVACKILGRRCCAWILFQVSRAYRLLYSEACRAMGDLQMPPTLLHAALPGYSSFEYRQACVCGS